MLFVKFERKATLMLSWTLFLLHFGVNIVEWIWTDEENLHFKTNDMACEYQNSIEELD